MSSCRHCGSSLISPGVKTIYLPRNIYRQTYSQRLSLAGFWGKEAGFCLPNGAKSELISIHCDRARLDPYLCCSCRPVGSVLLLETSSWKRPPFCPALHGFIRDPLAPPAGRSVELQAALLAWPHKDPPSEARYLPRTKEKEERREGLWNTTGI